MFTTDGELREEYRDLDKDPTSSSDEASPAAPRPTRSQPAATPVPPPVNQPPATRFAESVAPSAAPEEAGGPGFLDLVGLLAEPATIYLQEAHNADPQTAAQSLELARLHIDLLAVLRTKTAGNLSQQEEAMLEDVVYQLRAGYVGLRG